MEHNLRALRKPCEERLRDLDLPNPFSADELCDRLAAQRRRAILLRPISSSAGPCGVWVAGASADVIFYEQNTSPRHREHIILHELCHVIWGHRPGRVMATEWLQLLLPHLSPRMVSHVLQRATYSAEEDREAEMLASLILARVPSGPVQEAASTSLPSGLLGRLVASFEDRAEDRA